MRVGVSGRRLREPDIRLSLKPTIRSCHRASTWASSASTIPLLSSHASARARRGAVERAIGCQHRVTETSLDGSQTGRVSGNDLTGQEIGIDDHGAKLEKPLRHRRFARADPTGKSYAQHGLTLVLGSP